MVFRRRDRPSILGRLREFVYPRSGWRRVIEYHGYRVRRIPDTPHRIALGLACGVFASFTPFFGLHLLLALAVAKVLGGNLVSALIGTAAGNPLTFPFIASLSLSLGYRILGHGLTTPDFTRIVAAFGEAMSGLWESLLSLFGHGAAHWARLDLFVDDLLVPYLVGGLLPGLICGVASYYLARPVVAAFQTRRRARMLANARRRGRAGKSPADAPANTG